MFKNEYPPVDDVTADATNSSESDNRSTFTPEGPPSFEQLLAPTAPTILPDIVNLHSEFNSLNLNLTIVHTKEIQYQINGHKATDPVN